jgi:uncharacterized protein YyaL (SSP411 family)
MPARARKPTHYSGVLLCALLLGACGGEPAQEVSAPGGQAAAALAAGTNGTAGVRDAADGRPAGWRLADEASPYLRQHADNPVAWYPWGEEAFARAKALDRPVLLSFGYSSCHWCHVMEHETFMDAECARLLNEHFVPVKVDREQRPDVDALYMDALVAMTGRGGWPLTLFLTPEGHPVWGGTYFPAESKGGLPGFRDVLQAVHEAWTTEREQLIGEAGRAAGTMRRSLPPPAGSWDAASLLEDASLRLTATLDARVGGTHGAPKFPPALLLSFLLGQHQRSGVTVVDLVETSLDAMAAGGLLDHLAGGFHRYCVDETWQVPHFEKMLYDNALLAVVYAEAAAITGEPRHADVARATLAWMAAGLRLPVGLYAGAFDADSLPFDELGRELPGTHAEEGLYYAWTFEELLAALGDADGRRFASLYGVTQAGNFEDGRSILHPMRTLPALAAGPHPGLAEGDAFLTWLDAARAKLLAVRARRPPPFRDEKCLAGWNGLALTAFTRGGPLLGDSALRDDAAALAGALTTTLFSRAPLELHHQWFDGAAGGAADLFDHAAVARGLLDAHELLGDPALLADAMLLARRILERFQDPLGGFYDTDGSDTLLPSRGQDVFDGSVPSGTSLALELLERLAPLDDTGDFAAAAERAWLRLAPMLAQAPAAFPSLLRAVDHAQGPLAEIVLDGDGPLADAMHDLVLRTPLPAALVVVGAGRVAEALAPLVAEEPTLLAGRRAPAGGARAWVCVDRACLLPADDVATLAEQLGSVMRRR